MAPQRSAWPEDQTPLRVLTISRDTSRSHQSWVVPFSANLLAWLQPNSYPPSHALLSELIQPSNSLPPPLAGLIRAANLLVLPMVCFDDGYLGIAVISFSGLSKTSIADGCVGGLSCFLDSERPNLRLPYARSNRRTNTATKTITRQDRRPCPTVTAFSTATSLLPCWQGGLSRVMGVFRIHRVEEN